MVKFIVKLTLEIGTVWQKYWQKWDSNPRREDPTATWTQRLRPLGHPAVVIHFVNRAYHCDVHVYVLIDRAPYHTHPDKIFSFYKIEVNFRYGERQDAYVLICMLQDPPWQHFQFCEIWPILVKMIKVAAAGNRTQINCLEGNYANRYTTAAVDVHTHFIPNDNPDDDYIYIKILARTLFFQYIIYFHSFIYII